MEEATSPPDLNSAALSAKLAELLQERRTPPLIPGARLAPLVNEAIGGGWTYRDYFRARGIPNLRKFVDEYISPDVVRPTDERQGTDVLYAIPRKASAVEQAHEGKLWKTFVAVVPTDNLVYNRVTGDVTLLSPTLPLPSDCVVVPPVAIDEQRELCLAFCDKLESEGSTEGATALRGVLAESGDVFYQPWLNTLRMRKPLDRHWGQFRHDRLLELFEKRILAAGASAARAGQLKQQLALDHEIARSPKQVEAATAATEAISGAGGARESRERRARELLKAAAERLPYDQLMAVQLPLGLLVDLSTTHEK